MLALLRAKYYSNGNLLDTVFSDNSSPAWKGIEYGLQLVKNDFIWRIGNGSMVRTCNTHDAAISSTYRSTT